MITFSKVTIACVGFAIAVAAAPASAERRYITDSPNAPYSQGVIADDTLYISGTLGLDAKTGQPPADPKVEVQMIMDSIKRVAEAAGYKMDDIVNVQVFCTDLSLFASFNEVYRTYFQSGRMPARAFIGTDKLLRGARFEVSATAVKDD